jgi:hypothetical protein
MINAERALKKPKLLFQAVVTRQPHRRRFWFSVLIIAAALGAWYALDMAGKRGLVDTKLIDIGWLAAAVVVALMTVRAFLSLFRMITRKNENIRFFDRGFSWTRGDEKYQYGWGKVDVFREGGQGIYLGKRPLLQWGAHTLIMADGQVFKVTPVHGNLRRFARAVRPYIAEATGVQMARALRDEQSVRLHRKLIVWPGGVEIGKREIPWSSLNVGLQRNALVIQAKDTKGKFKTVKRYNVRSVDNVGGFVELATSTIRNHQRERFEKRNASSA